MEQCHDSSDDNKYSVTVNETLKCRFALSPILQLAFYYEDVTEYNITMKC